MKRYLTIIPFALLSMNAMATVIPFEQSISSLPTAQNTISLPSYFGSINNNTNYVLECSQVVGGYCANNPMPANG